MINKLKYLGEIIKYKCSLTNHFYKYHQVIFSFIILKLRSSILLGKIDSNNKGNSAI